MKGFVDSVNIEVKAGNGGNGCVSFRREKFIPRGGPNGGDGGKGGSVIFTLKKNMRTLQKLRHKPLYKAGNGGDGQGQNKHGAGGKDVIISVPDGSVIKDRSTGDTLFDFTGREDGYSLTLIEGGNGGWGNTHFKSSTNQAPRTSNKGEEGSLLSLTIELSIIADVGLVGFPNAGKSSLLNAFTRARSKVAAYPFTTTIPHLGVLKAGEESDIVIADIPGLIEGASLGRGMGLEFLRHIERTVALVFIIDAAAPNYLKAYDLLKQELNSYSPSLLKKPHIVLCNKIDLPEAEERAKKIIKKIKEGEPETPVLPISILENRGLKNLSFTLIDTVAAIRDKDKKVEGGKEEGKKSSLFNTPSAFIEENNVQYPGDEE